MSEVVFLIIGIALGVLATVVIQYAYEIVKTDRAAREGESVPGEDSSEILRWD